MIIEYIHKLENIEAFKRIDNLLDELQLKYTYMISNSNKNWNQNNSEMNFSMLVKGFNISGILYNQDKKVLIDIKLPLYANLMQGKIEKMIRKELVNILI